METSCIGDIVYVETLCMWIHCVCGDIVYVETLCMWRHCVCGDIVYADMTIISCYAKYYTHSGCIGYTMAEI